MLKLLLPEKIGSFTIYSQKVLSVYLDSYGLRAALVNVGRRGFKVEKTFARLFEYEDNVPNRKHYFDKEQIREAFIELRKMFPRFDQLRIIIPASLAVFKELVMPFSDYDKIKKILPFEIEPHIVFQPQDVSHDFLVTEVFPDLRANVMVTAIRDSDLSKVANAITSLKMTADQLGVDGLVLYELIKQIPDYQELEHTTFFLELGERSLTLGIIERLNLPFIRSFEFGLYDIAKSIEKKTGKESLEIFAYLEERGIEAEGISEFGDLVRREFEKFFADVAFALEAYCLNSNSVEVKLGKIILFYGFPAVKSLDVFCRDYLKLQSEYFSLDSWGLVSKVSFSRDVTEEEMAMFLKPIGFVSLESLSDFNLGYNLFVNPDRNIVSKQLVASIVLLLGAFGYLMFFGYSQVVAINKVVVKKETELVNSLKNLLPPGLQSRKRVTSKVMLKDVRDFIMQKKTTQLKQGLGATPSFLVILLELTRLFDRTRFGVEVNNLVIKQDDDFSYKIYVKGSFDQAKSATEFNNFDSFVRVLKLSRQLKLEGDVKHDGDAAGKVSFSLVLTLMDDTDENDK